MTPALRPIALAGLLLLASAAPARADDLGDAKAAVQKKAWQDAHDLLAKVLERSPDNREAALLAAQVYEGGTVLDAFPLAEDALNRRLAKEAGDREARLALARLYLAKGRVISRDPMDAGRAPNFFSDAEGQFKKILDAAGGTDDEAAAGIVEAVFDRGDFARAVEQADAFLAKKSTLPRVSYWKGQALYIQATDAWRRDGGDAATTKDLFRRAQGAYEASVKGDPTSYDAWLQLAYASQYVGDAAALATAAEAYEKAMDLDPLSEFPVKGIAALYANQPAKYRSELERLAKEKPKNLPVRWYLGYAHLQGKRWDEAVKVLSAYVKEAERPDGALVYLGQAYEGLGEAAKAKDAYEEALKANPDNHEAAGALERGIQAKGQLGGLQLLEAYAPLLKMAPRNPWIRNNLAFTLREIVTARGSRSGEMVEVPAALLPLLEASVKHYADASAIIGEWRPEHDALPWATRYNYAGILNDTGLMYYYYPQVRDLDKAKDLYQRALDFTEGGYRDAAVNLVKYWIEKGDFEEAHVVAIDGADALKTDAGEPDEEGRAVLRQIASRLVAEGKVKPDDE